MPFSTTSALAQSSTVLAGKWTYRSFHNNPAPVADDPNTAPQKALALIFAEAVFTFEIPTSTTLKGAIDWPGGGLDLQGTIGTDAAGASPIVDIIGTGRHRHCQLGIRLSRSTRIPMAERSQSGAGISGQRDPRQAP